MRILPDTNVYVAWKRGDAAVGALVRSAEQIFVSAVVTGELLFGFRNGSRYAKNRAELDALLANAYVTFLPVSIETADRFGRIAAALRRKGTPIPTNDIWIAAHAMETGAELLSFDRHFSHIDGLAWTDPATP